MQWANNLEDLCPQAYRFYSTRMQVPSQRVNSRLCLSTHHLFIHKHSFPQLMSSQNQHARVTNCLSTPSLARPLRYVVSHAHNPSHVLNHHITPRIATSHVGIAVPRPTRVTLLDYDNLLLLNLGRQSLLFQLLTDRPILQQLVVLSFNKASIITFKLASRAWSTWRSRVDGECEEEGQCVNISVLR